MPPLRLTKSVTCLLFRSNTLPLGSMSSMDYQTISFPLIRLQASVKGNARYLTTVFQGCAVHPFIRALSLDRLLRVVQTTRERRLFNNYPTKKRGISPDPEPIPFLSHYMGATQLTHFVVLSYCCCFRSFFHLKPARHLAILYAYRRDR